MKIGLNMDIGFIQNHTPVSVIFGINLCYGGIWPLFKSVFRGHFRNTTYTHHKSDIFSEIRCNLASQQFISTKFQLEVVLANQQENITYFYCTMN